MLDYVDYLPRLHYKLKESWTEVQVEYSDWQNIEEQLVQTTLKLLKLKISSLTPHLVPVKEKRFEILYNAPPQLKLTLFKYFTI